MQVYVWEKASPLSDSYSGSGGVFVVAATVERARDMIQVYVEQHLHFQGDRTPRCSTATDDPTVVLPIRGEAAEQLIVFADSGLL